MKVRQDLANLSTLVVDAFSQSAKLVQNEMELAKAELADKTNQFGKGLSFLVAGAVFVIPALVMALLALSAILVADGWSQALSYLVSAIVGGLIAAGLLAIGISRLDAKTLAPRETLRQLDKDKDAMKGIVK
jgi:TRAP-type C4-dicarboxylate transport system permease small subunit